MSQYRFYKVVLRPIGEDSLGEVVSGLLQKGWELYGPPFAADGKLIQAVVWPSNQTEPKED
jgi:hypothetical protein